MPQATSAGSVNAASYGGESSVPTSAAPSKKVTLRMPKSSLGSAISLTVSPRRYSALSARTVTAGAASLTAIGAGTTGN